MVGRFLAVKGLETKLFPKIHVNNNKKKRKQKGNCILLFSYDFIFFFLRAFDPLLDTAQLRVYFVKFVLKFFFLSSRLTSSTADRDLGITQLELEYYMIKAVFFKTKKKYTCSFSCVSSRS